MAPTIVETQIYVDQLEPLDLHKQTFGFKGYLRLWWTDSRLQFESRACMDTLNVKRRQMERIWKPELYWVPPPAPQLRDFRETYRCV